MKFSIPLISAFLGFVLPIFVDANSLDRFPFTVQPGVYLATGKTQKQIQLDLTSAWGVSLIRFPKGDWQGDIYLQGILGRQVLAGWSYGAVLGGTVWWNSQINPDVLGLQLSGLEIRKSLMYVAKVGTESVTPSFYDIALILNHSQFEGREIKYGICYRLGDEVLPGVSSIQGLSFYVTWY